MRTVAFLCLLVVCSQAFAAELPFKCEKGKDAFYPNQEDCQAYYECKDGKAELKLCSHGLEYNPETQQCDLKENAGCQPGRYASSEPKFFEGPIIPAPPGIDCSSGCVCRFKHDHCHPVYYECHYGYVYKKRCPHPLLFNDRIKNCDHPDNMPECKVDDCPIDRKPHTCTCITKYKTCCDGKIVIKPCPAGTAFNTVTKTCDRTTFLTSCGGTDTCTQCTGQNFGHSTDCTKYYVCLHNFHMSLRTCPAGTAFNKRTRVCDRQGHLDCFTTPTPPTPTPPTPTPPTPTPSTSTSGPTPYCDPMYCTHDGEYRHQTHCRRWCHCSNGISYEKKCPGATHFSPAHKRCESPGVADCKLPILWEE